LRIKRIKYKESENDPEIPIIIIDEKGLEFKRLKSLSMIWRFDRKIWQKDKKRSKR
jgi:hypothetical protein